MSTKRDRKVFSESFKRGKVQLIESNKATTGSIANQFDISYTAVYKWVKKYGTLAKQDRLVIETDSDYLKLKEVEKEKTNLERLVGRQQIRIDYYESLVQAATDHFGEDIEKKFLKK